MALIFVLCIGTALVGGVFLAFSSFVMRALAELPAEQGIVAMQRINVVVLNPLFLGLFMGCAVLSVVGMGAAFFPWDGLRSVLLLCGGLGYLVGAFGVTVAFNVPRNERLARVDVQSAQATDYWPVYVREWLFWNHVRTAASAVSSVFWACALALR